MLRFCDKVLYEDVQVDDVTEYVRLDQDIWNNIKRYLMEKSKSMAPIRNKEGKLVCFAYEDIDANREMRMLREIIETQGALQFPDIYPEIKHVKIYGFNELAYFFAKYLETVGVLVDVEGPLWKSCWNKTKQAQTEGECLTIYAEGINGTSCDKIECLLKTVSVEFECIDEIYEANLRKGFISDTEMTGEELLDYLKKENELIILEAGVEQLDAYNFLKSRGIEICCFMDDRDSGHSMFGKKILSTVDVRKIYKNAVYINCTSRHSAWGRGGVDQFDGLGYRRNKSFFVLKDYFNITGEGLKNIIRTERIALVGDVYLCRRLYAFLKAEGASVIGYINILLQQYTQPDLMEISVEDINNDTTCLLVVPELFNPDSREKRKNDMEKLIKYMKNHQINSYSDYFSYTVSFIHIEGNNEIKYIRKWLKPKRVILGAIESACGNIIFREILDDHPCIMLLSEYNYLNNDLMWICIRLSVEPAENILALFWKLYGRQREQSIYNKQAFDARMRQLLSYGDRFTSQELFVIIHIAYMYMFGKEITDARDMIIYWEPHTMPRDIFEESVRWLGTEKTPCDIVNIVRNIYARNGCLIKECIRERWGTGYIFYRLALSYPNIDKKDYEYGERVLIKFEDLKKHPKEILIDLCSRWGISWSDTLMKTTYHGENSAYNNGERLVKDFDLQVVYKTYDEYFSEFDKFRLSLINAPWQRKYGYPYVSIGQFSRRELQDLFLKEFRFEQLKEYHRERVDIYLRQKVQILVRKHLQEIRIAEFYSE